MRPASASPRERSGPLPDAKTMSTAHEVPPHAIKRVFPHAMFTTPTNEPTRHASTLLITDNSASGRSSLVRTPTHGSRGSTIGDVEHQGIIPIGPASDADRERAWNLRKQPSRCTGQTFPSVHRQYQGGSHIREPDVGKGTTKTERAL